jgi:hypothetical protein
MDQDAGTMAQTDPAATVLGAVPESFYVRIGRIVMVAALLESKVDALLWALDHRPQDALAGRPVSRTLRDIADLLDPFPPARPTLPDSVKDAIRAAVGDLDSAFKARNEIVHSVWPSPSADSAFRWRHLPRNQREPGPEWIGAATIDPADLDGFLSTLVDLEQRVVRLTQDVEASPREPVPDESDDSPHPLVTLSGQILTAQARLTRDAARIPIAASDASADLDRCEPRLSPTRVAGGRLLTAYDNARALALLWADGHVHLAADYVLLRSVFESAATALWTVAPAESDERLTRAHLVALDELTKAERRERRILRSATEDATKARRGEVARRIAEHAQALVEDYGHVGIADPRIRTGATLDFDQVLTELQELIPAPDVGFIMLWTLLSSLTHGADSSVTQMAATGNRPPDLSPDTGYVEADPDLIASVSGSVFLVVERADRVWRQYRGTP